MDTGMYITQEWWTDDSSDQLFKSNVQQNDVPNNHNSSSKLVGFHEDLAMLSHIRCFHSVNALCPGLHGEKRQDARTSAYIENNFPNEVSFRIC